MARDPSERHATGSGGGKDKRGGVEDSEVWLAATESDRKATAAGEAPSDPGRAAAGAIEVAFTWRRDGTDVDVEVALR